MPWEKSFDTEEALDQAIHVFLSKGYEATSLSDLTAAMGINKGSLYNAYGSKQALFTEALHRYDREKRQAILMSLQAMDDPLASIHKLFDGLIDEAMADTASRGCLLTNTAIELPHHNDYVRDIVRTGFGDFERFFHDQIVRGQQNNSIPQTIDVDMCAKGLLALVIGLRVLSRGASDKAGLAAIKTQALQLLT